jgi:hypothetical protein
MSRITLPTWATTVIALIAGVLVALNQTTFDFDATWKNVFTVALIFIGGLGISPLTGNAFRNALHLPQNVITLISAGSAALAVGVTTFGWSSTTQAIVTGVLAVLATLGFGTSGVTVPPSKLAPPS